MREIAFAALLLLSLLSSPSFGGDSAAPPGRLKMLCLSEDAPLLSSLAAHVCAMNPELRLSIGTVESFSSISEDLASGEASLGIVESGSIPEDSSLTLRPFAFKGLAVVANGINSVDGLSSAQLEAVMDGRVKDWSELGGRKCRISLVLSEDLREPSTPELLQLSFGHPPSCGCGLCKQRKVEGVMAPLAPDTRDPLLKLTQERALSIVAQDEGALTLVDLSNKPFNGVKFLKIDGFPPTQEKLLSSSYPLGKTLFIALSKDPSPASIFLAASLSGTAFSKTLLEKGLMPYVSGVQAAP